jgi:hypothetical protein
MSLHSTRPRPITALVLAVTCLVRTGPARRRVALSLLICLACALPAFVGTSARAGALAPTLLDASGSMVSVYGGWAAWSRADLATNAYVLVLRSPKGAISLAPIPERASPFDVELGPDGPGVAAVYSRCSDIDTLEGCHIYELKLGVAGATEQMLEVPGSSVHEPAIWGGLLVFLRRNPGGEAHRPDNLFQWRIGSSLAHSVALPTSRGGLSAETGHWPKGQTGTISGLTIHGRQLAYSTTSGSESFGVTSLWLERIGSSPKLVDQVTSGASATCEHAFLSPTLLGGWLYAYLHDCDPYANPRSDRWTRYSLGGRVAQRAKFTFVHTGDEIIDSVVPDSGGVDWSGERGLYRLSSVVWRTIKRPVPETFCSLAHPLC